MTRFTKNGAITKNIVRAPHMMSPLEKKPIAVSISVIMSAHTNTTLKTKKLSNTPQRFALGCLKI